MTYFPYERQSPPPRSRKLVAGCLWSWGPGSERNETYFISGVASRRKWRLWANPYCDVTDANYWHCVAYLTSETPVSRKQAAELLLQSVWTEERTGYGTSTQGLNIDSGGVLSAGEVEQIAKKIGG